MTSSGVKGIADITFTFQYVSILITILTCKNVCVPVFTFQYVSILIIKGDYRI